MKRAFFILPLILLLGNLALVSQIDKKRFEYTSFTADDVLDLNVIDHFVVDTSGLIYFSTGLLFYEFDGSRFRQLKTDSAFVVGQTIALWLTSDAKLIAICTDGIYELDRNSQTLKKVKNPFADFGKGGSMEFLAEAENNLIIIIERQHFIAINKDDFTVVHSQPTKLHITNLPEQRWTSTNNSRIYLIENNEAESFVFELDPIDLTTKKLGRFPNFLYDLITLPDSDILVISGSEIIRLDSGDLKVNHRVAFPAKNLYSIRSNFMQLNENTVLVSIGTDIFEYDLLTNTLKSQYVDSGEEPIVHSGAVRCMFLDSFQNIYLSTQFNGFLRLKKYSDDIKKYSIGDGSSSFAKTIWPDKASNKVLVGTFDNGIMVFDTNQNLIQHINSFPHTNPPIRVSSIIGIDTQKYWLSLTTESDYLLDLNVDPYHLEEIQTRPRKNSHSYYSSTQKIDKNQSIHFRRLQSARLDYGTKDFFKELTTMHYAIHCGYKFDGFIYSGLVSQLAIQDAETGAFIDSVVIESAGIIRDIAKYDEGHLLLASDGGLFRLKVADNSYQFLENGITLVYSIVKDGETGFWLGTQNGLINLKFDGTTRRFDKNDGLPDLEFNSACRWVAEDGEIYMGTIKGGISFHPDDLTDHPSPRAIIWALAVNGNELNYSLTNKSRVELSHDENHMKFELSTIGENSPDEYNYQYKLGESSNWVDAKEHGEFSLSLSPGDYVLYYAASQYFKENPDQFETFHILIKNPWWATWYFRAISVLAVLAAIIYYMQTANQKKLQKKLMEWELQQKMQKEKDRLSRELHDNIGVQVATIRRNADWMLDQNGKSDADDKMKRIAAISQISNRISSDLRDTIWASKKAAISIEELGDRLKVYIAQVREANPKVQILFKEAYDARFMVGPEVALNLFRIVQEGIQNAIKHSEAAEIKVLIKTSDQEKIILTIADDGIGFEPNNSGEVGHGLRNMLFRANEIDLDFRIESKPGIGSTVFVQHKSA